MAFLIGSNNGRTVPSVAIGPKEEFRKLRYCGIYGIYGIAVLICR